ncbi:MAG: SAM-dependent methyltransferase [Alphaproteobacteria bacterium]|nr:SAM-dependent methyltransferase [Alphaproteobacteria bacterium]
MARPNSEIVEAARRRYAREMAAAGGGDARIEAAFAKVPREDFLGPPPWRVIAGGRLVERPVLDASELYRNVLVVLDRVRGINNGEPALHAAWIGAVRPQPGETVVQVGAGTGYYTAILGELVRPGGRVFGYEFEPDLAGRARRSLAATGDIEIRNEDATRVAIPACDVLYVNAGVAAPPVAWLDALLPGARAIFPWRPSPDVGLAVLLGRRENGIAARALMPSWFIACAGSPPAEAVRVPGPDEAWRVRSIWRTRERAPDGTALAIHSDIWFSSREIER